MRARIISFWFMALLIVGMFAGCNREPKQTTIFEDPKYKGWKFYVYQNVKIFYQPGHPQEPGFEGIAAGYVRALDGVSKMLNMPIPDDTVTIIFYTGWGQGRELTGRQVPFAENGIIHFWIPSHLGVTFMHWFIPYWEPKEPAYPFLWHGLVTLFDYSGYNYHGMTLDYISDGRFIPLAALAVDTTIDSNTERLQSAEAASFIAFFLAWYGPDRLKELYRSELSFETAVRDQLFITVDSLQRQWINVVRANHEVDSLKVDTAAAGTN